MSTRELVRGIIATAEGHSKGEPLRATLTQNAAVGDLTLRLSAPSVIPPGIIEIGTELMFLESHSAGSTTGTVAAWGRGYNGTSRFSHTAPAEVIVHPRIPKSRVLSLINQIIDSLYPILFQSVTTTYTYDLLTNSDFLIDCPASPLWVGLNDERIGRFKWANGILRLGAPLTDGDSLTIVTPAPGTRLNPDAFANDTPFTDTGLAPSVSGLVELGVLARLFAGVEGARMQPSVPEASDRAQVVGIGASASLAKLYQALFQQRLELETRAQNERNPLTLTWSR